MDNRNFGVEIGQHPDERFRLAPQEDLQQDIEQLQQAVLQEYQMLGRWLLNIGLTAERIGRFEHFNADESLVGEDCIICLDELQIGVQMVRLDCHVNHVFCKKCTDIWFKDHKKCPLCNHVFN